MEGSASGYMSYALVREREANWPRSMLLVLAIVAAGYLWSARLLFLDDAFIHLRIAKNLHELGFYSFNGDSRAYCTSSPLYTALLAALLAVYGGVLLPKFLGVVIYGVLFLIVARALVTAERRPARWLWLLFLLAIVSPLGVRWLCDGMETGLVAVAAIVLARVALVISTGSRERGAAILIGGGLLGLIAVLLRVEFCLLVAMIGFASLTLRPLRVDRVAVSLALGSALGVASLYAIFGAVLPDTAIAKAAAGPPSISTSIATLLDIAKAHAAASSLGVIVFSAWLYSAIRVIRHGTNRSFSMILNATFPLIIAMIAIRHQAIQGYRYFVFMEFFLLAYNIAVVDTEREPPKPRVAQPHSWNWVAAACLIVVWVCWQAMDFRRFSNMIESRAASFVKIRDANLTDLKGTYGIAWDVGLIGFFSEATILDGNGLVNGREFARLSEADRLRWFVAHHPIKFVFGNEAQLIELREFIDLHSWRTRETLDFQNFSAQPDRHFMIVRPD